MHTKPLSILKEWIVEYVKNKDIFAKSIKNIKKSNDKITVEYTDKIHTFIIIPFIKDINSIILKLEQHKEFISLVTFNSKENLNIIIQNWNQLLKNPKFSIYFVNPFSELEKKWIIHPYTHSKISSPASLKKGLLALFSTVEEIKKEDFS